MNWWKIAQERIMYVMRGLPGSGKSSVAQQLVADGVIISADDFRMQDGEYKHRDSELTSTHQMAQNAARDAMQQGISPIVIVPIHILNLVHLL